MSEVTIAGAGLAGLMTAYGLSERGVRARVFDLAEAPGASWAAAGMLCPGYEALSEPATSPQMAAILSLARAIWQDLAPVLEAETERPVGYVGAPGVVAVLDDAEAGAAFDRASDAAGVAVARADQDVLSRLPHLAPDRVRVLPADGHVDNRAVIDALQALLSGRGVEIIPEPAPPSDAVTGVFIDARGWQVPGVKPVRGVALAVEPWDGAPPMPVRFGASYVVPHADRVVIGASVEPGRSDRQIEDEMVEALVARADAVVPGVKDAERLSVWSGVRPRSPDGMPVLGAVDGAGGRHHVIGGMHRNGVLLSPLLGAWLSMMVLDGEVPDMARPLSPQRFSYRAR